LIAAFHERYPYYKHCDVVFRVIRFRVRSEKIERDENVWGPDLFGMQEIIVPDEEAVEYILRLWQVPLQSLVEPRHTDIPV